MGGTFIQIVQLLSLKLVAFHSARTKIKGIALVTLRCYLTIYGVSVGLCAHVWVCTHALCIAFLGTSGQSNQNL